MPGVLAVGGEHERLRLIPTRHLCVHVVSDWIEKRCRAPGRRTSGRMGAERNIAPGLTSHDPLGHPVT